MKRLPPIPPPSVAGVQQAYLKSWAFERALELEAREESLDEILGDTPEQDHSLPPSLRACDAGAAKIGEIRLLHPDLLPGQLEPLYVAVISEWRPLGMLVTPFSPYDAPAFDGELLTSIEQGVIRTLCVWNSLSLPLEALERSWVCGSLPEQDCRSARALYRHLALGEDLSASLPERIGPPITAADDPRNDYIEEEIQRVSALFRLQMLPTELPHSTDEALYLIAEAFSLTSQFDELMDCVPGRADEGWVTPVCIFSEGEAPDPESILMATADEILVIGPGEQEIPSVIWQMNEGPQAHLANVHAALLHTARKTVIGSGTFDPTGTYLRLTTLRGIDFHVQSPPDALVLMVYIGE